MRTIIVGDFLFSRYRLLILAVVAVVGGAGVAWATETGGATCAVPPTGAG